MRRARMDYIKWSLTKMQTLFHMKNKKFVVAPNRLILYNLKPKKVQNFDPNNPSSRHVHKSPTFRYWVCTTIMPKYREGHEKVPIKMESLSVPNHKLFQNILHFLSQKKNSLWEFGISKFWALKKNKNHLCSVFLIGPSSWLVQVVCY
jgi:hypothetical protein